MAYDEWHVFCRYMLLQILFGPTASVMSHQHFSLTLWVSPPLASLSVYIRATGLIFLIMVATLAGSVLVLAAPAVVCVYWGKFNVLWIIFGDANFRGIHVIADLEEVFKGCFLLLFLCWWGFYAELHVVDEPTFCHNQLLWLFLRLHLVLPLERGYSNLILLLLCLLLWFLLYV